MDLKVTIKIEYQGDPQSATVAVASVNSAHSPEGPCPDCLKQEILDALLARSDLTVTVEDNECRYHWTAEERREHGG